jgi:ABC-2 type transport system permease protein
MTLKHTWVIYKKATLLNLSNWMTYRSSFIFFLIGIVVFNLFGPILAYIIYSNNLTFPGWTLYQIYVLIGSLTILTGLGWYFTGAITWISEGLIRKGKFDTMLIHPFAPLKLLILKNPDVGSISELCFGSVLVIYAMFKIGATITSTHVLFYLLTLLSGVMFLFSTNIIIAALNFYFVRVSSIQSFVESMIGFSRYPINIYGPMGLFIFTFLFPIGLISYYPATALTGSANFFIVVRSLLFGGGYLLFSLLLWRQAMKHYTSAGG